MTRGIALSVMTGVLFATAALIWRRGDSSAATAPENTAGRAVRSGVAISGVRLRVSIARNPFRLDGRLAPPEALATDPPTSADAPSPSFDVRLKGLVGGPPWRAVLSGLPGVQGDRTVRAGERFGLLQIVAIDAAGVSVEAVDSTWTVTLERERVR